MLFHFVVVLSRIPPKAKHLMGVVENSHKADNEYFLMIHTEQR